jgi:ribonuclease-3
MKARGGESPAVTELRSRIEDHERLVRQLIAKRPFCRTGLGPQETTLFCAALTHDSFCNEAKNLNVSVMSYERLEFLGDAVLELLACEFIYTSSDLQEGKMTEFKQDIVANHKISERVTEYGLGIDQAMLVGNGHRKGRGKSPELEENMRADSFEALIGATYILYGMDEARRIVHEVIGRDVRY